jgi:hypothetical protein
LRNLIKSYHPIEVQRYFGALHLGLIIYRVSATNIIGALHLYSADYGKKTRRNPFPDRIFLTPSSRGAIIFVETTQGKTSKGAAHRNIQLSGNLLSPKNISRRATSIHDSPFAIPPPIFPNEYLSLFHPHKQQTHYSKIRIHNVVKKILKFFLRIF